MAIQYSGDKDLPMDVIEDRVVNLMPPGAYDDEIYQVAIENGATIAQAKAVVKNLLGIADYQPRKQKKWKKDKK